MQVGLESFLMLAAALFAIGLYGAISKKSTIGVLMSLEIMSMAISLNFIALNRWVNPTVSDGWFFSVFQMVISAAEIAIGLALIVAIYRRGHTSEVSDLHELKG